MNHFLRCVTRNEGEINDFDAILATPGIFALLQRTSILS